MTSPLVPRSILFGVMTCLQLWTGVAYAEDKPPATDEIPLGGKWEPRPEVGVFVTASSGGRIWVSRDDGKTWEETLMVTTEGDGDHGPWGFQNLQVDDGLIAAIFGWTGGHKGGRVVGTTDGRTWRHLSPTEKNLSDSCGGVVADGMVALASTPWGGVNLSHDSGETWEKVEWSKHFPGVSTHHMRMAWGEYQGGRLVALGDGPFVASSADRGKTWTVGTIEGGAAPGYLTRLLYGNGVFIFQNRGGKVGVSKDGGVTWQTVETGVEGAGGFSFVNGVFILTGKNAKGSADGLVWKELPEGTPAGVFAASPAGTLINVSRGKAGVIQRSEDGGKTWEVVVQQQVPENEKISWRFQDVVYGKVSK